MAVRASKSAEGSAMRSRPLAKSLSPRRACTARAYRVDGAAIGWRGWKEAEQLADEVITRRRVYHASRLFQWHLLCDTIARMLQKVVA